jgi:hypothetical protein
MMDVEGWAADAFVYTGPRGERAPRDVVRVRVDPSVTSIPAEAFSYRNQLTEVKLCEGLVEIGDGAFRWCNHSITKINIPNSLRRINDCAFSITLCCAIRLHDGIESIGASAFAACIFTNFRVPPLITVIPHNMLDGCTSLFSVEMPLTVEIKDYAFSNCYCLRNVAIPPNAIVDDNIFGGGTIISDLQLLFGSRELMSRALRHRFDRLPIHSIVYYRFIIRGCYRTSLLQ